MPSLPPSRRDQQGFTLVELLVVIGVIAILISILLPVLSRSRESANSIKCRANLQQIAQALAIYVNENRDHFPSPDACGDSINVSIAAPFRRGIDEPDPLDGNVKETLGLHNLLYRRGYAKHKETWLCPSAGGRSESMSQYNSYTWNVTKKIAGYTSLLRGRVPKNSSGSPAPQNWWYVQDNTGATAWATNQPKLTDVVGITNSFWYMPHQYRVKRINSQSLSGRQGSTNVLFYDLSIGTFVYNPSSTGPAVQTVVRGE